MVWMQARFLFPNNERKYETKKTQWILSAARIVPGNLSFRYSRDNKFNSIKMASCQCWRHSSLSLSPSPTLFHHTLAHHYQVRFNCMTLLCFRCFLVVSFICSFTSSFTVLKSISLIWCSTDHPCACTRTPTTQRIHHRDSETLKAEAVYIESLLL